MENVMKNEFLKGVLAGIGITLLSIAMVLILINFTVRKMFEGKLEKTIPVTIPQSKSSLQGGVNAVDNVGIDEFFQKYKSTEEEIKKVREKMRELN